MKKISEEVLSTFENVNKTLTSQASMQKDMLNLVRTEIQVRSKQATLTKTASGLDTPQNNEPSIEETARKLELEQQQLQKTFSKLPSDLLNRGLTKPQLMRLSVVYEFIDTEVDYVRDLNTVLSVSLFDISLYLRKYVYSRISFGFN